MRRAWRLAYAFSCTQFLIVGFHFGAFAPIGPRIEAEWALQPAELGLLGSLLFYAYAAVQIPAGVLADAIGSRRTLVLSGLLMASGAGLSGVASGFAVALGGRLLLGIGMGLVFTAGVRHIARTTAGQRQGNERFIALFGKFVGLNYLGIALASIPLVLIVNGIGWRVPLLGSAALSAAVGGATWMVNQEQSEPDGVTENRQLVAAFTIWRRRRTLWVYTLMRFFYGSFVGLQTLWVVPLLLITLSYSQESVGLVLLAMALGQAAGPSLSAWLARTSIQPLNVLKSAATAYAIVCLALLALVYRRAGPLPVTVAFLLLAIAQTMTLIGYGFVSVNTESELQGTIAGMVNVGSWLGSAVFQLAVGLLVQGLLARWEDGAAAYAFTLVPLLLIALAAIPLAWLIEASAPPIA